LYDNFGAPLLPPVQEVAEKSIAYTHKPAKAGKTDINDDIKKEPILRVLLDVFDGEVLLNK
jgi:hypothetical protein